MSKEKCAPIQGKVQKVLKAKCEKELKAKCAKVLKENKVRKDTQDLAPRRHKTWRQEDRSPNKSCTRFSKMKTSSEGAVVV